MANHHILWADDEIDLLKPHILFLKSKGYDVTTANNGRDAIELAASGDFDLIILDENMPGLTGLETLSEIKVTMPHIPVIMITKSEEEDLMNQALGNKIADYLIKPVNPNQIFLSLKKLLHSGKLVNEQTSSDYRRAFAEISGQIASASCIEDWYQLYSKLTFWEMQLTASDTGMSEMLQMQKTEANTEFAKFVKRNYEDWVGADVPDTSVEGTPLMSPLIIPRKIFPLLDNGEKVFFIVIDNFRLDQWQTIRPILAEYFSYEEDLYCSILPTATQYARNSIFSGLMPLKIAKMFPDLWVDEDEAEGKNLNEAPLIETLFSRYRRKCRFSYNKINDSAAGEKLIADFANLERDIQRAACNLRMAVYILIHRPYNNRRRFLNIRHKAVVRCRCHQNIALLEGMLHVITHFDNARASACFLRTRASTLAEDIAHNIHAQRICRAADANRHPHCQHDRIAIIYQSAALRNLHYRIKYTALRQVPFIMQGFAAPNQVHLPPSTFVRRTQPQSGKPAGASQSYAL